MFQSSGILHERIQKWGQGPRPTPWTISKLMWFLSNTSPDLMENHKATKPEFNVGPLSAPQRNTIYMVLQKCAEYCPLLVESSSNFRKVELDPF